MNTPSSDLRVLDDANATITSLIAELRAGHHDGAPLREQVPRIERLADAFDLAGYHDAARGFRQQADALVLLYDREDWHTGPQVDRWWRRLTRRTP